MTAVLPDDHARETYDGFARHYDAFTAAHRYDEWTATLEGLARRHGLRGTRLLDVACGTGKSFLPFVARGYDVTACDVSGEMVARARAKAPGIRVEVHDMRVLPPLGEFDLVCCLDDAVNYLLTAADVAAALAAMARNLAPGGVLVFDVNSVRSYRDFYGGLSVVQAEGTVVALEGRAAGDFGEGQATSAVAEVLHRGDDGRWRRRRVTHHQRHHPRAEVEAALAAAGLAVAGLYGMQLDGSVAAGFEEHGNSKAVYVARWASAR